MTDCSCSCGGKENERPRLVYACSGAADVGLIADMVARKLRDEKFGAMSCLAGVGAGLSGFIESAKEADNIIIDGCPVSCGKKMFEQKSLPFKEIVLTQQGLIKGSTPVTSEIVSHMTEVVKTAVIGQVSE